MRQVLFSGCVILLALAGGPTRATGADIINRRADGSRMQGEVQSSSRTELVVKATGRTELIRIPANDVASVQWDGGSAHLGLGHSYEDAGRLDRAVEEYQAALAEIPPSKPLARADAEFLVARATARLATSDPEQAKTAVDRLTQFTRNFPDNYNYFDAVYWLGQVYLEQGNNAEAQRAFDTLAQAPWEDVQRAGRAATARLHLARGDFDQALSAFNEVLSATGNAGTPQYVEAALGKTEVLLLKNQPDEALALVSKTLETLPTDQPRLEAQAYVYQGDALLALERPKEALLAYLHVDLLFADEPGPHAAALYHLSSLWNVVQHAERADDARARLQSEYPRSPWTQRLTGNGSGGIP